VSELSNLPRRLRDSFEKGRAPRRFTGDNAIERFKLVAAAGSDGQEPIHSFEKGSSLILSDFPPGTILREKCFDSEHEEISYIWWCVGDYDKEKGVLEIFDANSTKLNPSSSVLLNVPHLRVIKRRLISERRNGEVDYKVGEPGSLVDFHLKNGYDTHPQWRRFPEARTTLKIDVIEYGTKVKEEKKGRVSRGLRKLQLAPKGAGVNF